MQDTCSVRSNSSAGSVPAVSVSGSLGPTNAKAGSLGPAKLTYTPTYIYIQIYFYTHMYMYRERESRTVHHPKGKRFPTQALRFRISEYGAWVRRVNSPVLRCTIFSVQLSLVTSHLLRTIRVAGRSTRFRTESFPAKLDLKPLKPPKIPQAPKP